MIEYTEKVIRSRCFVPSKLEYSRSLNFHFHSYCQYKIHIPIHYCQYILQLFTNPLTPLCSEYSPKIVLTFMHYALLVFSPCSIIPLETFDRIPPLFHHGLMEEFSVPIPCLQPLYSGFLSPIFLLFCSHFL